MRALNLADIQGNVLRGYNMDFVRIILLRITDRTAAKRAIARTINVVPASSTRITSAEPWHHKPEYALNIGVTAQGLQALGIPITSFPQEFRLSLGARAEILGDVAESAPENWISGLACSQAHPAQTHLVLILHVRQIEALEPLTNGVREEFLNSDACTELNALDGAALPERRVHFGYVDGIGQPIIEGSDAYAAIDPQRQVPVGEFFLGHPGFNGAKYPVPQPDELGVNGTFLALRILKQNVDAFETFLERSANLVLTPEAIDPKEFIAAKMCGRWRNGLPLALSPSSDRPDPPIPPEKLDEFDYVPSERFPNAYPDTVGLRCPIGSHIRRNRPRSGVVAGGGGDKHRIVRRGIPYGPSYDPLHPNDGHERGLIGLFFCASLGNQFEFLQTEWINQDAFGLHGDLDPVTGNNEQSTSRFVIPQVEFPGMTVKVALNGFGRFVVTRGAAYCFIPSFTGLRYLAQL